jgi:hypothetical protein
LPEDFSPISTLFYNRALFERSGEALPQPDWPWSRLLDTARRLTSGGGDVKDVYGYGFLTTSTWEQFVYNHGGLVADSVERPTRCVLDQAPAVEGVQFVVDLMHRWQVQPSPQAKKAAGLDHDSLWFPANRQATYIEKPTITATWLQQGDNLRWGLTLGPKGQDGKWHYASASEGWGIPKEVKTPDASWALLEWQVGPQGWRTWLAKRSPSQFHLPAIRSLAEQEAQRLERIFPNASLVLKSAESAFLRPQGARFEKAFGDHIHSTVLKLMDGTESVRAALTEAVARANAVLSGRA